MSTPKTLIVGPQIGLYAAIERQREAIKLGEYVRLGKLDALYIELEALSNPKMIELGKVKTPDGRQAWPGKNLDWLGEGPPIAQTANNEFVFPCRPFPLPPPCPDPTFVWKEPGDMPARIPQRIEDRAVRVAGTRLLCIQPISQIQWVLDFAAANQARREIHRVEADAIGQHMAFIIDLETQMGHLVGGRVK